MLGATILWNLTFSTNIYGLKFRFVCCHGTKVLGWVFVASGLVVIFSTFTYYMQQKKTAKDLEISALTQFQLILISITAILAFIILVDQLKSYNLVQDQVRDRVSFTMKTSHVSYTLAQHYLDTRDSERNCHEFYNTLVYAGVYKPGMVYSFQNWGPWIQTCCTHIEENLSKAAIGMLCTILFIHFIFT